MNFETSQFFVQFPSARLSNLQSVRVLKIDIFYLKYSLCRRFYCAARSGRTTPPPLHFLSSIHTPLQLSNKPLSFLNSVITRHAYGWWTPNEHGMNSCSLLNSSRMRCASCYFGSGHICFKISKTHTVHYFVIIQGYFETFYVYCTTPADSSDRALRRTSEAA